MLLLPIALAQDHVSRDRGFGRHLLRPFGLHNDNFVRPELAQDVFRQQFLVSEIPGAIFNK